MCYFGANRGHEKNELNYDVNVKEIETRLYV